MLCSAGVHECTFRVDNFHNIRSNLGIGIVQADKIDIAGEWIGYFGYALYAPTFHYPDGRDFYSCKGLGGGAFRNGDTVTVTVDLDARKISFKKNGIAVGGPQVGIALGTYYFACNLMYKDHAVTIVGRK